MTELNCTNRFMKSLGDFLGDSEGREARHAAVHGVADLGMTEQLGNNSWWFLLTWSQKVLTL